jgi:hypothetical protein
VLLLVVDTEHRAQSASTVHQLRATHAADEASLEAPFCLDDFREALFRMAYHKAPVTDGLPTELFKYSGPSGLQILLLLFNLIHDRECIHQGWREGTLVLAPKTRDLTYCTNCRGLTLLPAAHRSGTHNPDSAQERHSVPGGH